MSARNPVSICFALSPTKPDKWLTMRVRTGSGHKGLISTEMTPIGVDPGQPGPHPAPRSALLSSCFPIFSQSPSCCVGQGPEG